jgi:hypothetical protein
MFVKQFDDAKLIAAYMKYGTQQNYAAEVS